MDHQIASSDIASKMASNTIKLRVNERKTDTPVVVQRWVITETWVVLHLNLGITKLDKDLKCGKLDSLRSGGGVTAPRSASVRAGIGTGAQSNHCVILIH